MTTAPPAEIDPHDPLLNAVLDLTLRKLGIMYKVNPREREALLRLFGGGTYPEIGKIMGISSKTVEVHVWNIGRKLSLSMHDLRVQGLRQFWIEYGRELERQVSGASNE